MRVAQSLIINCPIDQVWRVFDQPANLPRWQPTLKSVEALSGTPGQVGAISRLIYSEGGRDIVLTEMVVERGEPQRYICRYESAMLDSTIANTFTSVAAGQTRWTMVQDSQFRGLLRFIGLLTRPIVERKFREDMARFKALAEGSTAI